VVRGSAAQLVQSRNTIDRKPTFGFDRRYNHNVATTSTGTQPGEERTAEKFTLGQRLSLSAITWAACAVLRLILPTLRWTVEFEEGAGGADEITPAIIVFWHRCIVPGMYWYRGRNIAVMTSSSFDGEYIARIIEKFGYGAVRGSSTRGGVRALLGMHTVLERGQSVAFTIDGPKGPRYVAKPGPVLLARNTGVPICTFHLAVERAWVFRSWDRLLLPKPFSRVLLRLGTPIRVEAGATSQQLAEYHAQMQAKLDGLREASEAAMKAATGRNA
jgi:lysophospholipid acyltransferase (LPLAT)-like uncharacterized protein